MTATYDRIAPTYDRRYAQNRYPGIEETVARFAGVAPCSLLEVGCGTGHWLAFLQSRGVRVAGLDRSAAMLERARTKVPDAPLVAGEGERLPFAAEAFERVLLVHALHHLGDARRALREARRVLRPNGALMTIGLDPARGLDRWSIYDFFPTTRARDLERYPDTPAIRAWMTEAGFDDCRTELADRLEQRIPARQALAEGRLDKPTTSQLIELSDDAYARGRAAVTQAADAAEARGEVLVLESDLHLYATVGRACRRP